VGVCFAADREGKSGLYASLESIHAELERIGLTEIYAKPDTGAGVAVANNDIRPVATGPIVRGQVDETAMPPSEQASITIGTSDNPSMIPSGLSEPEIAALEEISNRAASQEVICIIRSKESGGSSEVLHLDQVSKEFIQALQALRQKTPEMRVR
jgi:hypothetical protein